MKRHFYLAISPFLLPLSRHTFWEMYWPDLSHIPFFLPAILIQLSCHHVTKNIHVNFQKYNHAVLFKARFEVIILFKSSTIFNRTNHYLLKRLVCPILPTSLPTPVSSLGLFSSFWSLIWNSLELYLQPFIHFFLHFPQKYFHLFKKP